ncbi:hypothetical protein ACM7TK_18750 [Pseudomonas aeruginosa]
MIVEQLLRPFGYLAIRHRHKWKVDWLYPGVLALITTGLILMGSPKKIVAPDGGGLIQLVLSFVQGLPGFYIAALAAIATFGRPDIDEVLPAPTPKVVIRSRGVDNLVDLTRRRFLAMLFSFLTAESLLIIIFSLFLVSHGAGLFSFYDFRLRGETFLAGSICFLYFLLFYQMIVSTFWGLYYLGYKLHE